MNTEEKIKALEAELREERESNMAKSKFLARMSHSVRTPITAVMGISEIMLHDTTLPAHVEEAFNKIYNSGKILLGIANDILDLPKVESGELPLSNIAYNIAKLISDITQLHLVHLGSRKIAYKVNIDSNIPEILIGDELRIKLVLDNLLTYAFKYTETGTVELKAHWEAVENKKGNLIFVLRDTGVGMNPETPLYNEDFHKCKGLGIPITLNIVKMLGATINVQSEPGMGTIVKVSIPQEAQSNVSLGTEATQNLARFHVTTHKNAVKPEAMPYGRVLVVDDVDACLFVVKGLLGFYEIETDLATHGGLAIEKIRKGNEYDIIFMDHIMPEVDGVTATRVIREAGYTKPIIAITANAIFGQETEYLKNGFDAVMSKPINTAEFDTMLHRFIRNKQPQHVLDEVAARVKAPLRPEEEIYTSKESRPEVVEKLRQDFARKQKDVYTEITIALGNGKPDTAKWHLDTVKNMAGMIGEPVLSKIATDVAHAITNGEIPTRLLEMLNQELTTVLADIPEESSHETAILSNSETHILFDNLYNLLATDCAECMFLIEKLHTIPNSEELIRHIENFDFPSALKALAKLRTNTEVCDG